MPLKPPVDLIGRAVDPLHIEVFAHELSLPVWIALDIAEVVQRMHAAIGATESDDALLVPIRSVRIALVLLPQLFIEPVEACTHHLVNQIQNALS